MPDITHARFLRKQSTAAEKLMWAWLRSRRFSGYKFRRNHPVANYILDFYCHEAKLSIELDGAVHGLPEKQRSDAGRTQYLASLGIKELRFWNSHLLFNKRGICETIFRELHTRSPRNIQNSNNQLPAE